MTEHKAVTFDVEAFAVWLDSPSFTDGSGQLNRDAYPLLATAYQKNDGEAGWIVSTTLSALADAALLKPDQPQAWTYGPGVGRVAVWATDSPEGGPDGGLVGEVTVDGVTLSFGHLLEADLIPADAIRMPGYEAAAHALSAVAAHINAVAAAFRASRPANAGLAGALSGEQLEHALTLLAELWRYERIGQRGRRPVEQSTAAEAVLAAFDASAVEGELV